MKHYLIFVLFLLSIKVSCQTVISGVVKDFKSNEPLEFVNVVVVGSTIGTSTDSSGNFSLRISEPVGHIRFSLVGYDSRTFEIYTFPNSAVIFLHQNVTALDEFVVKPKENPAWSIIRKIQKNRNHNDPNGYKSFEADFYTKIKMERAYLEPEEQKSENDKIPIWKYFGNIILENTGMLYHKNGQTQEVVEHSISNLPKIFPINLILINNINPFGFYDPYYRFRPTLSSGTGQAPIIERNYISPLNSESFSIYDFDLSDTLISDDDTTFHIRFQPYPAKTLDALKGNLKVSSNGYALTYIEVSPVDSLQTVNFKIKQEYVKETLKWYPTYRDIKLEYPYSTGGRKAFVRLNFNTRLSNIRDSLSTKAYFDGTTRLIDNNANQITWKEFERLRPDSISKEEQEIYKLWEFNERPAIKNHFKIMEWPFRLLTPSSRFMLTLNQFNINYHEKLRVGLGVQNNLSENPRFGIRASIGYGLGDKTWKYKAMGSLHLSKDRYNRVTIYDNKDIVIPGKINYLGHNYSSPSPEYFGFNRAGYYVDEYRKTGISVFTKPMRWTWFRFYVENERRQAVNYQIDNEVGEEKKIRNYGIMLRFVRNETFVRQGLFETLTNQHYPIINLNFQKSFISGVNKSFWRSEFKITQQFRWSKIGSDMLYLSGGVGGGELPYNYLYNNQGARSNLFGSSLDGFLAGNYTQYAYNQFVDLNWIHNFGKNIFRLKIKWSQPEIAIGNRISWSYLSPKNEIQGIELSDFSKGFYEANLYLRNLLKIKIYGLPLGIGTKWAYNYSKEFIGSKRLVFFPTFSLAVL